jgi:ribonuclease HI
LRLLKENGNVYGLMDRLAKKAKKKNKQRVVNPVVNKLPEYLIYIDGACDRNGQVGNSGGHGYVVVKNDEIVEELVEYEDNTTNNRQELMAALSAIRWVVSNQISDYVIYSDSQYAVNSITNWIHSWKKNGWVTSNKTPVLNKDILLLILEEIAWLKTVNMKWIKGHDGNKWNEYIDRLVQ